MRNQLFLSIFLISFFIVSSYNSEAQKPFSFYVATDVHMIKQRDDYTSLCFRNQILKDIKEDSTGVGKFIVVTGDMDPFTRTKQSVEQVLGVDYRFYPVIGNHDVGYTNNDYAKFPDSNWCNVFDIVEYNRDQLKNIVNWGHEMPTPGLNNLVYVDSLSGKEYYSTYDSLNVTGSKYTTYSFDEGNSHFVVLDIYAGLQYFDTRHMGRITNQLYDWLAKDLAKTQKENIFVFAHQPVWKCKNAHDAVNASLEKYFKNRSGEFGADSLTWFEKEFTSKIKTREEFWNLLKENNVVAYFCGHTHHYTANNIDGVWEINLELGAWQNEGSTRYGKIIVDKNRVELLVKGFIAEPKHFETIDRILLKRVNKNNIDDEN
jgi:UDP-2,3-diacylglucosamine pyrophosphatase LpxH